MGVLTEDDKSNYKAPKNKTSHIWSYYEDRYDDDGKIINGDQICRKCKKVVNYRGSTNTMIVFINLN